jgi:hypothetical protein
MSERNGTVADDAVDREEELALRDVLRDWVGQQVRVQVVLQCFSKNKSVTNPFPIALDDEATVKFSNGFAHLLGHCWVQHSEEMKGFRTGQRVVFTATVHDYVNRDGRQCYGLGYPSQVATAALPFYASSRPEEPVTKVDTPKQSAPPPAVDPIETILRLRDRLAAAGGADAIRSVLAAVEQAGGWPAVVAVRQLAEELGGAEKINTVLDLLKF